MTPLPPKYSRIERERRFLLHQFPSAYPVQTRRIADRYIDGTLLRLREQTDAAGQTIWKLTKKIPVRATGAQRGYITTIYLTEAEYRLVAQLPARTLSKVRHSIPPFGIDVFEGPLLGLLLAEAEFDSAEEADAWVVPDVLHHATLHEVTDDERFTVGQLVCATRRDIEELLAEHGVVSFHSPRRPPLDI